MPEEVAARSVRTEEMLQAIKTFAVACANPASTIGEVISPLLATRIFEVDRRLCEAHADDSAPPASPARGQEESKQDRMRRGWSALFACPWPQLKKYRTYLAGKSALATHQVVKGSEYSDVMVVMDDASAGGFLISYDKIFGGVDLSDTDRDNPGRGKETTIDRTLRLLYVTCSRARETLALVLWPSNPAAALVRIRENGWFSPDEVMEIPNPLFPPTRIPSQETRSGEF